MLPMCVPRQTHARMSAGRGHTRCTALYRPHVCVLRACCKFEFGAMAGMAGAVDDGDVAVAAAAELIMAAAVAAGNDVYKPEEIKLARELATSREFIVFLHRWVWAGDGGRESVVEGVVV